jgi:hypothetical protein
MARKKGKNMKTISVRYVRNERFYSFNNNKFLHFCKYWIIKSFVNYNINLDEVMTDILL